jgi:hypothetical protein
MVHNVPTRLNFDELGEPYYLKTNMDGKTEKILPEQTHPPIVKSLTVQVVLKRSGYSPEMKPQTWYGLQTLQISIPDEKRYRYYFLCYDKKIMDTVVVKVLDVRVKDSLGGHNSICWTFNPKPSRDSKEYDWIKRVGKVETISALKVQQLIQDRAVLGVISDDGLQAF